MQLRSKGSTGINFLNQLMALFSKDAITIPDDFYAQTELVENELKNDSSGLVNSILNYSITSACVDFSVESSNKALEVTLNNWLHTVNKELIGKIPVGIKALAKEYYRERWKKSSLIVLRTLWESVDGYEVPTKLWFVDGKSIKIDDNSATKILGGERYSLKTGESKPLKLPATENELIYIQKPFEDWGCMYPTPYLVRNGVLYNLIFSKVLTDKGSNVVKKALEYLMLLKKGDPELVKLNRPELTYSEKDLKDIKDNLQNLFNEMRGEGGMPVHVSNFDTQIEHLIPDYGKILDSKNISPVEKRILAGLGFVEVVEGVTSSRKESVLNPKVFMAEVQSGVNDFSNLLKDILLTIIDRNKSTRRKMMNSDMIEIRTSPIKSFMTDDAKVLMRSLYDRGIVSKRTMVELGVDVDFDAEVERRRKEQADGLDDSKYPYEMYPPLVQNLQMDQQGGSSNPTQDLNKHKSPDKTGPEKVNYNASGEEIEDSSVATDTEGLNSGLKKKRKKKKNWNYGSDEVSVEVEEAEGHTHTAVLKVSRNVNGDIIAVLGITDDLHGHFHNIATLTETESMNGHKHKMDLSKVKNLKDEMDKAKLKVLLEQQKLLKELNKSNETTQS